MELTNRNKICKQNGAIPQLYTDDKKSKYSSKPNDVLESAKNFNEKLYTKEKLPLLNFFVKFLTKRKSQINNFTIARQTFF